MSAHGRRAGAEPAMDHYVMLDSPMPWAPTQELLDFLAQWSRPDWDDHPEVQQAVQAVKRYLAHRGVVVPTGE